MATLQSRGKRKQSGARASLIVRLDPQSKTLLKQAANLRRISISDYVRQVTVGQARKELQGSREQTISLTAEEQLAFWKALNAPVRLTPKQRRLGAVMRGES